MVGPITYRFSTWFVVRGIELWVWTFECHHVVESVIVTGASASGIGKTMIAYCFSMGGVIMMYQLVVIETQYHHRFNTRRIAKGASACGLWETQDRLQLQHRIFRRRCTS